MPKLTRYLQKIFANNSNQVGVFGTGVDKETSKNVETLQSADYEEGWSSAIITNKNYPIWQERDGVDYGFSYQLAYLMQAGIPEWISTETYYTNSYCRVGSDIYYSLQDDNTNHNPALNDGWWFLASDANTDLSNLTTEGNAKLQYAPFAINDGTVSSGENATLTYSGSDLTCDSCTITTCKGKTKSFDTSSVIDCSSLANGTYRVLKDFEDGSLSTVLNLSISKTAPATPASGDCWLDISTIPANFKTYNGSSWVTDNDKVYLGNVKVSSGVITKVTNNVFNQFYSDEIIRINTDLDFSNVITVSTTNSTSSQNYTCLSDGVLFVSAHSYSSSSSSKDVRALVYYDEENETTSNGNYLIGSATQLLARASRSCLKGEKVYFLINATGGTNTCYAKFVPYKK